MLIFWAMLSEALHDLKATLDKADAGSHVPNMSCAAMSVSNGVATIPVMGPLLKKRSAFLDSWGITHTGYDEIINAINAAESDSSVKSIELSIDSPGGTVDGWFEAMDAVRNAKKPKSATVLNMAASAAYGLAASAGELNLSHKASSVGSVGVVVDAYVSDSIVSVTSTNAPKKRHDLKTEEGKAALREELDQYESLFIESIADGRGVSADTVKKDYGQGGLLIGANAIKNGMADSFKTTGATGRGKQQATSAATQEKSPMTLDELKAQHPELYKQVMSAGKEEGVTGERDRVNGHLEAAGDIKAAQQIALEAIKAGDDLNQKYFGKYLAAARNESDLKKDESDAAPATPAADVVDEKTIAQDATLAKVFENLGIEVKHG